MELVQWLRLGWDRVAAWICVLAGVIALVLGWIGVSDQLYMAEQIPYVISAGLGGMFLLGVGGILWLSADLRDEWTQLDRLEELIAEQLELSRQDVSAAQRSTQAGTPNNQRPGLVGSNP
jgi:hypothetical protein